MGEGLQVRIEQEAMAVIDELRKAHTSKMSVEALARAVFPDTPNARMIIQAYEEASSKRENQISVSWRICKDVLGCGKTAVGCACGCPQSH